MTTTTCPDRDSLTQLLLGRLTGAQKVALEQHLAGCQNCVEVAESLSATDEFTELLRRDPNGSQENETVMQSERETIQNVVERVKATFQRQETVQLEETVFNPGSSPNDSVGSPNGEGNGLDFLSPPQSPDELGRLGDYRVLEVLGMGGMGVVLKAEDLKLKRLVALKTMRPSIAANKDAKARFVREAQATAALSTTTLFPFIKSVKIAACRSLPCNTCAANR